MNNFYVSSTSIIMTTLEIHIVEKWEKCNLYDGQKSKISNLRVFENQ